MLIVILKVHSIKKHHWTKNQSKNTQITHPSSFLFWHTLSIRRIILTQDKLMFSPRRGTKVAADARRKVIKFYSASQNGGRLAMALVSTQLFPSSNNVSSNIMVTAFSSSFCLQVNSLTERRGFSSSSELGLSKMNQSFKTWSFDEPVSISSLFTNTL